MNYYEHHIGDYAAATAHLSLLEDAIYSRLLRRYYLQEEPLPGDLKQVARLAGARTPDEVEAVEVVLAEFFVLQVDGWHNKRADEEIARYLDKRVKAKASANASVAARRGKAESTNAELRSLRMSEARKKGKHTAAEWNALVAFCGGKCVRCGAEGHLDRDHILPVYQGGSDGIENIQPLCARCNASKGPEDTDHRPNGWQAFVERSLSGRSTLQTPDTSNQEEDEEQQHVQPLAARCRFAEFWAAYPNKKGKQEAEKTWKRRKLDGQCDQLIAHVLLMAAEDSDWARGYVPMGSTYLNQARWEDVPKLPPRAGPNHVPPQQMGKTAQALMALEEFGNGGLDQAGNFGGPQAAHVLGVGSDPGGGGYSADRRRLAGGRN